MSTKLKVVLCWNMHQPAYFTDGQYQMPWVYLHAIKDYVDMAAHLEAQPQARAVVNFVPVLLEQIDDYAQQIREYLDKGMPIRDPLLAKVCGPLPRDDAGRWQLIDQCSKGRMLARLSSKPYQKIQKIVSILQRFKNQHDQDMIEYLDEQFFVDLVMWYHLAWLGETVNRRDSRVQHLRSKGKNFDANDRRHLLTVIGELLSGIIPRYRVLAEKGQIELSMSPYAHPMIPLLLNMRSVQEAKHIPNMTSYNEETRIDWQIAKGLAIFDHYFAIKPHGCWPPEGGICEQTVRLLEKHGFHWVASDEQVLAKSLTKNHSFMPYQLPNSTIYCFFRHHDLSNKIAFHSAEEGVGEAVGFLKQKLEEIARSSDQEQIVSLILDGENPWESFRENGYHFLNNLYATFSTHPDLALTTFGQCCDMKSENTPTLKPGSWSKQAKFTNWVSSAEKKEGWEQLNAAKRCFDQKRPSFTSEQCNTIERQLAICEGSDWFYWMGSDELGAPDFVELFRRHLKELYLLLGEKPPSNL